LLFELAKSKEIVKDFMNAKTSTNKIQWTLVILLLIELIHSPQKINVILEKPIVFLNATKVYIIHGSASACLRQAEVNEAVYYP